MLWHEIGSRAQCQIHTLGKITPFALRNLIFKTAEDLGGTGFDYNYGWGLIDPAKLLPALAGTFATVTVTAQANGRRSGKKLVKS